MEGRVEGRVGWFPDPAHGDINAFRLNAKPSIPLRRGPLQCDNAGMFDVVLYQPEIPPNTGNVIRLCANAGARLHLIEPMGFTLDHARMRRAGLDYHEFTRLAVHRDLETFISAVSPTRLLAFSSKGTQRHDHVRFAPGDALMFGPETRGLPADVVDRLPPSQRVRLPMMPGNRSLNLSNAVAIAVYEAWRQHGFAGADSSA